MNTLNTLVQDNTNRSEFRDQINNTIAEYSKIYGTASDISDGYHTFSELYDHRAVLFAALCAAYPDKAWKSKQHDDPNFPMFKDMFICGLDTPNGQVTYHYDIDPYWELFKVKELERAPKYDGHTPNDVVLRLKCFIPD